MENERKIVVEVEMKAQNYRHVLFGQQWKRVVLIAIIYLIIIIPTLWLTIFGVGGNSFLSKGNDILIVMSLFGILPVLMAFSLYLGVWKQAEKVAKIVKRARFIFTEKGLESITDSSTSQMDWNRFIKIRETAEDFIFYSQENVFFAIPKYFIQNETQIAELKQLFREQLGAKAKLKT